MGTKGASAWEEYKKTGSFNSSGNGSRKVSGGAAAWAEYTQSDNFASFIEKNNSRNNAKNRTYEYLKKVMDYYESAQRDYDIMNWGNASDLYAERATSSESLKKEGTELLDWLKKNQSVIGSQDYNTLRNQILEVEPVYDDVLSVYGNNADFYGQFATEEDYLKWDAYSTTEKRQATYQQNMDRLEELKKERDELYRAQYADASTGMIGAEDPDSNQYVEVSTGMIVPVHNESAPPKQKKLYDVEKEIASLEAEINMYQRGITDNNGDYIYGSKVIDDYSKWLTDPAYEQYSGNRDYDNPSWKELAQYDAYQDKDSWTEYGGGTYKTRTGQDVSAAEEMYKEDPGYVINDPVGLFLSIPEQERALQLYRGSMEHLGMLESVAQAGWDGNWEQLTDDELGIYYTIKKTQGDDAAMKYISDMTPELNRRGMYAESTQIKKEFDEANGWKRAGLSAASVPIGLMGGVMSTFDNVGNILQGKEINPYSRVHAFRNYSDKIRTYQAQEFDDAYKWEIPWVKISAGDLYQSGMSVADTLLGAMLGAKGYQAIMSSGAAASKMQEYYEKGASDAQIATMGAAAAFAEWITEKYSIESLLKIKDIDSGKQIIKALFYQAFPEATEEMASEVINYFADAVVMGTESEWQKALDTHDGNYLEALWSFADEVAAAGVSGFFSGIGSGGGKAVGSYVGNYANDVSTGRSITDGKGYNSLMNLALEMGKEKSNQNQRELMKQSERILNEDYATDISKQRDLGRLHRTVQKTVNDANVADISKALQDNGYDKKTADSIADAFYAAEIGNTLTEDQSKVVKKYGSDEKIQQIVGDIILDDESSVGKRNRSIRNFEYDVIIEQLRSRIEKAAAEKGIETAQETEAKKTDFNISEDGKAHVISSGKAVDITAFASAKDGKVMLRTSDGEVVPSDDVSYANESQAIVFEIIANMGIPAKSANILLQGFLGKEGINAEAYARGLLEAFEYGKANRNTSTMSFSSALTPAQLDYVYRQGRKAAKKQTGREQARVIQTVERAKAVIDQRVDAANAEYTVILEDGLTEEEMTPSQKASYEMIRHIPAAMKGNVRIYDGKTGEFGYYDPKSGDIYLNINSTRSQKSMMAFAMGHELVHRAKDGSPAKYQKFADFLIEQYGKQGSDVEAMIAEQKQAAKDHGLELTDEQAFDEVVADACQRMLLDTNAGQRLAEFGVQSKQNQSIVQDVIQWIRDILEKLRNIFADVDPDSLAAQEFAKFDAGVKQILADMYVDMTIDAGENLSVIKKAFGSNTQVSKKENKLDATEGKYRLKQLQEQGASFMLPKSENKKITMSMTDSERTEVLKDKVITAEVYDGQSDNSIIREKDSLESRQLGMIKSALRRIAEEFDVYVDYKIEDVDVKFTFSQGNLDESVSKKITPKAVAKLMPVLRTAVENAIGIESHVNRYLYDTDIVRFDNLVGGYVDGDSFVPVRFGLKHRRSGEVILYVIVDQEKIKMDKIKAEVVKITGQNKLGQETSRSAFKFSLADIIQFVNGGDLLRYVPDDMINESQRETKWNAIADTIKRTNDKNDRKYTKYIRDSKLRVASLMVKQASQMSGYTAVGYHQTGAIFTEFSTESPVSGKNDSETPNGIFLKTNDHDIGLGGNIQMKVFFRAENILHFANRKEANAWYRKNVPGYDALQQKLDKALKPYRDQINAIEKQEWDESKSDEEIDELFEEEDRVIKEMGKVEDSYRAQLRELLDKYFLTGESGYDCIELDYDGHRWVNGKREDVHTFIVFHPSQVKSADVITYDDNGDIIPISQRFDSEKKDIRYKLPVGKDTSPRALLTKALDSVITDPVEKQKLQEYRENIEKLNEQEAKLRDLKSQIKDLSFAPGPRDTQKIKVLREEATKTENRINLYDKRLLRFEASSTLQKVLQRERDKVRTREREKTREAVEAMRKSEREEYQKRIDAIKDRHEATKAKMTETRNKAEARKKIRRVIRELDKIFTRGDKKRNVKEGLRDVVASALASAEVLFTDTYTNDDMIRNGVGVVLTEAESKWLNEAIDILAQLDNVPAAMDLEAMNEWIRREDVLNRKLSEAKFKLKGVFERERIRKDGMTVASILSDLADSYKKLSESGESYIQGAYKEEVYQHLLSVREGFGTTRAVDMRLEQLDSLYDAYKMVLTTVRDANKLHDETIKETAEKLSKDVVSEVRAQGTHNRRITRTGKAIASFSWNNEKPVYAFERLGSKTLSKLYWNIRKGQDTWAIDMMEADDFRRSMYDKYHRKGWDMDKKYTFKSSTGLEFSLNLEQIMSLYAYSKRAQAHDHLLKGGIVFDGETEVTETKNGIRRTYLVEDATTYKISVETLADIVGTLDSDQKAFVDEMQDYLSTTMGNKGNQVSMKMYGINLFKEKFYFPLRSAGQFIEKAREADLQREQGQISLANSGFTQSTAPNASSPVVLSGFMDVWSGHVNNMSNYHAFVLPLEDFRRVYNYKTANIEGQDSESVYQAIQNAHGTAATAYIDQLYRDLNGGVVGDPRENIAKKMIGLFKQGAVMASSSVVIQQPSALVRSFAMIDPKYFGALPIVRGVGRVLTDKVHHQHQQLWEELKKHAPVAMIKEMGYFDTGMGRSAVDFLQTEEYHGFGEKAKGFFADSDYRGEVLSKAAAKADELTWIQIWNAVKNETADRNPGMNRNSEEFLKIAGERFSEVIDRTQVYDSVFARSGNMRSKRVFMNIATAFMAEPTTSINMIEDAIRKFGKGYKGQAARTIGAVFLNILLNSALVSLIYAARDDDEDETYLEKYVSSFVTESMDGLFPMTYYPFLKDVWSILQGYDVERADLSLVTDVVDVMKNLVKLHAKDTSDMDEEELAEHNKQIRDEWLKALDGMTAFMGLPVKNVRRDFNGAINMYKTLSADFGGRTTTIRSLGDVLQSDVSRTIPVLGWLPQEEKEDKLFDALVSGDTAYVERLKSTYKDEKTYQSAIRSVIGDRFVKGKIGADKASRYLVLHGGLDASQARGYIDNWTMEIDVGIVYDDLRKQFVDQKVTESEAVDYLVKYGGKREEDAEKAVREWGLERDTGIPYSKMKEVFLDKGISEDEAIEYMIEYGGKRRDAAEETVNKWQFELETGIAYEDMKTKFIDEDISESEAVDYMVEYGGKKPKDAEAIIKQWTFEKDTGIPYDDMKTAFLDEKISESEAIKYRVEYGGAKQKDAEKTISLWKFEAENTWDYENRKSLYLDGEISAATLKKALIEFGDYDPEDADLQVQVYEWNGEGYDDVTLSAVRDYNENCAALNVPKDTYLYIRKFANNTQNDVVNGKDVDWSAVKKIMREINAQQGLTPAQKTALARSIPRNWKDSTIQKYKLW